MEFVEAVFGSDDAHYHQHRLRLLRLVDFLDSKSGHKIVLHALQDSSSEIRVRGLQAAYRIHDNSPDLHVADLLLSDEEPFNVRKWAVHLLSLSSSSEAQRILRFMARDQSVPLELRVEAIYAMTNSVDDRAIGTLCTLLGDSHPEVRQSSAWALAKISAPSSIMCLLAALEDSSDSVREWAARALLGMHSAHALQCLVDALHQAEPNEQIRLIRILVADRSDFVLRAIAQLLCSDDVRVRRHAAWAMGVARFAPSAPLLQELIDDEDDQVRRYAVVALRRMFA